MSPADDKPVIHAQVIASRRNLIERFSFFQQAVRQGGVRALYSLLQSFALTYAKKMLYLTHLSSTLRSLPKKVLKNIDSLLVCCVYFP